MAPCCKTTVISINLRISFVTALIPIVLYNVQLFNSAPLNESIDLQVEACFLGFIKSIMCLLISKVGLIWSMDSRKSKKRILTIK
tara:strand:- start:447 stop:701 length:255 start_codon:yes stop_codon:yes gene_type:complete